MRRGSGAAVRGRLLDAAAASADRDGLSAVVVDAVCVTAGVTKGALYHHFDGREGLLAAVAGERVAPPILQRWSDALADVDVLTGVTSVLRLFLAGTEGQMLQGCPLLKLGLQAPQTGDIHERVAAAFRAWRAALSGALAEGRDAGVLRPGLDTAAEADFVIAALEGALSLARAAGDPVALTRAVGRLVDYVETLRAS